MGHGTKIEWAHHTYNPWIGCTKISPACDHCYAAEWDKRYNAGEHWGAGSPRKRTTIQTRNAPYKWARQARASGERPRVFCASLADVFDKEVPAEWRDDLWQVIRETPELDWLLLTKRIGNVRGMLPADWGDGYSNVWLGITVVTQAEADRDIPKLLDVPAAVRFLSCEPLLDDIKLATTEICPECHGEGFWWTPGSGPSYVRSYGEPRQHKTACESCGGNFDDPGSGEVERFPDGLHWVIAGGESGPGARPMHPDWVRSLRDQCAEADVPFLFKQWGDWVPYEPDAQPPFFYSQHGDLMDGHNLPDPDDAGPEWDMDGGSEWIFRRVGKKAAGRLLDGVEHNGFPTTQAEAEPA